MAGKFKKEGKEFEKVIERAKGLIEEKRIEKIERERERIREKG